ncbi:13698_t:CDS:2 [Cetraspora pellucida]|uniref:13698_t:CDS:1 n=1 Tax=Cetraspora pellucida TaxID=1433469 RepID=A0A9N9GW58_9GLOM|nr:13698_t:CDS:2 [Cetraspora pellucida]
MFFIRLAEALRIISRKHPTKILESTMNSFNKVKKFDPVLIISPNHNWIAQSQQEPIGTAWILNKVGVRKSDVGEDDNFFKR